MHIVILSDTLDMQYAGVYYYTRNLIDTLIRNHPEHRYTLVRSQKGSEGWNVEEIIVPLSKIPGHASYRLFFTIPSVLNKLEPDWVVEPSHFGPFNLIEAYGPTFFTRIAMNLKPSAVMLVIAFAFTTGGLPGCSSTTNEQPRIVESTKNESAQRATQSENGRGKSREGRAARGGKGR